MFPTVPVVVEPEQEATQHKQQQETLQPHLLSSKQQQEEDQEEEEAGTQPKQLTISKEEGDIVPFEMLALFEEKLELANRVKVLPVAVTWHKHQQSRGSQGWQWLQHTASGNPAAPSAYA